MTKLEKTLVISVLVLALPLQMIINTLIEMGIIAISEIVRIIDLGISLISFILLLPFYIYGRTFAAKLLGIDSGWPLIGYITLSIFVPPLMILEFLLSAIVTLPIDLLGKICHVIVTPFATLNKAIINFFDIVEGKDIPNLELAFPSMEEEPYIKDCIEYDYDKIKNESCMFTNEVIDGIGKIDSLLFTKQIICSSVDSFKSLPDRFDFSHKKTETEIVV